MHICEYMVRFFWLPFYLSQFYEPQTGNLVSVIYDLGNILGGILVGYLSDFYRGRRACVIGTFTCVSIPFLMSLTRLSDASTAPSSPLFFVLAMLGVFCGGPINIITSAVAIDLAEHSSVGGRSDLMLLTGFINGCGSIIAALGLLLVGPIASSYGWHHVWNILVGSTVLGTLLLSPAIVREIWRAPFDDSNDRNPDESANNRQPNHSHSEEDFLAPLSSQRGSGGYGSLGRE